MLSPQPVLPSVGVGSFLRPPAAAHGTKCVTNGLMGNLNSSLPRFPILLPLSKHIRDRHMVAPPLHPFSLNHRQVCATFLLNSLYPPRLACRLYALTPSWEHLWPFTQNNSLRFREHQNGRHFTSEANNIFQQCPIQGHRIEQAGRRQKPGNSNR